MKIKTYSMPQSTILRLYADREEIDFSPPYQRNGGIWNLKARQLLIDSILNEFDIPKMYFHVLNTPTKKFAIIDGRQRLETIVKFIDGEFPLSDDFEYYADNNVAIAGLTYQQIAERNSKVRIRFDSTTLPIVLVEADDEDLIDDMFSRLNEAEPLNAAEKRNAFGGKVVEKITAVSNHKFFSDKVRFGNKRYQHREVATRLLFLEHSISNFGKIFDTKKEYMDAFAKDKDHMFKKETAEATIKILDAILPIFGNQDALLRSQSIIPIYYLLFRELISQGLGTVRRDALAQFKESVEQNRSIAEEDLTNANFELLEFDRLSQQGTNDASSIEKRLQILAGAVGVDRANINYV